MDDYISRQAAVSRFSDLLMVELKGKRLPTWDEVYNAMQDVPSASSVRQGQWVEDVAYYAEDGRPCIVTRCNQCGEPNPVSKFCPNCGARMGDE